MNIKRILLIIIIIYLIFSHFKKNKNIENFALSDDENKVKTLIKDIYNADMDAIRTLNNFSKNVSDGKNLNIIGNLTVRGNINSNHIYTKTLDIKGKYGTTHFNYQDTGKTYIRDDFYKYSRIPSLNWGYTVDIGPYFR
jgi:hypothetical protein